MSLKAKIVCFIFYIISGGTHLENQDVDVISSLKFLDNLSSSSPGVQSSQTAFMAYAGTTSPWCKQSPAV